MNESIQTGEPLRELLLSCLEPLYKIVVHELPLCHAFNLRRKDSESGCLNETCIATNEEANKHPLSSKRCTDTSFFPQNKSNRFNSCCHTYEASYHGDLWNV